MYQINASSQSPSVLIDQDCCKEKESLNIVEESKMNGSIKHILTYAVCSYRRDSHDCHLNIHLLPKHLR